MSGFVQVNGAISSRALGMDDTLRNTLAVEVRHLFKQQEVFKYDRPAVADRD
jgi:hypothetical protein